MKLKRMLVALVVLALAYFLGMLAMSFYVQKIYEKNLAEMQKQLSLLNVTITEKSYQLGVFTSNAYMGVNILIDKNLDQRIQLNVDSTIHSGPWLGGAHFGLARIQSSSSLDTDTMASEEAVAYWSDREFASAETLVDFTSQWQSEILIQPVLYVNGTREFELEAGRGVADNNSVSLVFPHVRVAEEGVWRTTIENMRYALHSTRSLREISGTVEIGEFVVDDKEGGTGFELNRLFGEIYVNQLTDRVQNQRGKLQTTYVDTQRTARLEMGYEIGNLDYLALWTWNNYRALPFLGKDADHAAAEDAALLDFLRPSPTLRFDVSVTMGGQSAVLKSRIEVDELSARDLLLKPEILILGKTRASLDMRVPTVWVSEFATDEKLKNELKNLVMTGVLVTEGADYIGEYIYEDKALTMNGRKVELF